MLCAALTFERYGGMTSKPRDAGSDKRAETKWVDSVVIPFEVSGKIAIFLVSPVGRDRYYAPLVQIGLRLATQAERNATKGVPPGWDDIGRGFQAQAHDLIQMYSQIDRLQAQCIAYSLDDERCGGTNSDFSLNGESLSGDDFWDTVFGLGLPSPVLSEVLRRDPDVTSTAHKAVAARELLALMRTTSRELVRYNHGHSCFDCTRLLK